MQASITGHREIRGQYLIEASAFHLTVGNRWQPRLKMTRLEGGVASKKSQYFPGLKPEFETAGSATHYARDLGRDMADHGSSRLIV